MKAFLIDPYAKTITEVDYSGDYRNIYEHIDADTFDCARFADNGDAVFVDDNGLINGSPRAFFHIQGYPQPLTGKGLVLGCDEEGESVEPRISLEQLQKRTKFLSVEQVRVIDWRNPPEYFH